MSIITKLIQVRHWRETVAKRTQISHSHPVNQTGDNQEYCNPTSQNISHLEEYQAYVLSLSGTQYQCAYKFLLVDVMSGKTLSYLAPMILPL